MIPVTSGLRSRFSTLSLRKRVSLLVGVGVGLVALLISITAFLTVRSSLLRQGDADLLSRAQQAAAGPLGEPRVLRGVEAAVLGAGDIKMYMLFADARGIAPENEHTTLQLGSPELEVAQGTSNESIRTVEGDDGERYRVVAVAVDPETTPNAALIVAQSVKPTDNVLAVLGTVLFLVGVGGVALAAWAGFEIARTGLRPVERLTGAAEHIARTGDLRPIPVQGDDEIARLTHAFNAMLGTLAGARQRERRLVADAGHELRTPLTSLRTNLDLLAQSEDMPGLSAEDRKALLDDVRAQVVELSTLIGDLVELSRDDPPQATARVALDLADITAQAVERVRRRAPNVTFDVVLNPCPVLGDPQALERAVTNLLDNAAKWSRANGVVRVRLENGALTITDQGPGISDADLPHVFERFYRSAEARTMPGSGLGLAIVKQAVDRHGGTIRAGRGPEGGAMFTVSFPHA